jgi:hypothetical protein
MVSISLCGGGERSSEAKDEREVEEAEGRGLSTGEMSAEELGVESAVTRR